MKKTTNLLLVSILLLSFLFTNCEKSDDDDSTLSKECNISREDVLSNDMQLVYTVTISGDADCEMISYQIGDTKESVNNPVMPWSITSSGISGDSIKLSADAKTKNGGIALTIKGNGSTSELELNDECSYSN